MSKIIKAKIENLTYKPGLSMKEIKLKEYNFSDFDINTSLASGLIKIDNKNTIAYSKWITPKRTRSYPFARIYDTYTFGGKRITVIPVIKDEGFGTSNNDRINFITLSWMNLTNIYVVLAWYEKAEKLADDLITNQKFDVKYVNKKIKEISQYQFDAHHWNNEHFIKDFVPVFKKSVSSYENISNELSVKLHKTSDHINFLNKFIDDSNKNIINLNKFAEITLSKSKMAANREIVTNHRLEHLSLESEKPVFEMKNNLGGSYFLTADELIIKDKKIIITEAKNSTNGKLPGIADVKDGLFKILLFSQIKYIKIDDIDYSYKVGLKLSGNLSSSITLPNTTSKIEAFFDLENLSKAERNLLILLNEEATENNYNIDIIPNK